MTHVDYLIIGGGVAGTTAAETIRAANTSASIHIISDEAYRFYSRIMLSKPSFFLEKIPFDQVYLRNESWPKDNNISFTLNTKATSLDPKHQRVTVSNGDTIEYGKLLLALGSDVVRWTVPGAEKSGIHYLRTLDDAKGIIAGVKSAKRAIVIGGGFIGFEMCDMLKLAGLETTLIIRENYFWEPVLDEAAGRMIEAFLTKGGVSILAKSEVGEVLGESSVQGVRLKDGRELPADMIIVGIGTKSPVDWVAKAGIACNRGILANEFLQTNDPNIYTAGDVAEYGDKILNEHIQFGNWANAQMQGKTAALNMMGGSVPFRHVSFYSAQGLGASIVFAGDVRVINQRTVIQRGSPESGGYTRIIVEDGEIEGATMINRTLDLMPLTKMIELDIKFEPYRAQLADPKVDLKQLLATMTTPAATKTPDRKIRIGWFSFSCCEDSTIVFTELMNDHWQDWKRLFDFRHARVLKKNNILDELDIAFIEGAIASPHHVEKLKEIRAKSKKLVAIGACAVVGMPSAQRNTFSEKQQKDIQFLLKRFKALPKVLKVADVVPVDASVPGCPMDPKLFLQAVDTLVKEFQSAN